MEKLFDLFYQSSGVSTDTRKIEKDCLFICLKGANFNGNTFAEEALKQGAKYVIVDEKAYQTNEHIYLVEDALIFLQSLANFHRNKFKIPVIGITGSNGKTSTKELVNHVLKQKYEVLATSGNLNNHIGVPLTLLQLKENHEIAIIEMGANKFKDIEELCNIAEPNHGIITNIGKAHLEGFKTFEGVQKTKQELYLSVAKNNGTIFFNADDNILMDLLPANVTTQSYGTSPQSKVQGNLENLNPFVQISYQYNQFKSPTLQAKMVGKYNFYNYLAAISIGIYFEVSFDQINHAVESYTPENNRSQVKQTIKNTLILDCYNANPSSMKSAIESFSMIKHPNKMLIIGDMRELGDQSLHEHQQVVSLLEKLNLKTITVGPIFIQIKSNVLLEQFDSTTNAMNYLGSTQINDALILLKGSRGIGLEVLESLL